MEKAFYLLPRMFTSLFVHGKPWLIAGNAFINRFTSHFSEQIRRRNRGACLNEAECALGN